MPDFTTLPATRIKTYRERGVFLMPHPKVAHLTFGDCHFCTFMLHGSGACQFLF
jgi:hypothetical protein